MDYRINQHVTIHNGNLSGEHAGRIVGTGTIQRHDGRLLPMFIVELTEGFYSPDGATFVSCLLAHPDNMRPLDEVD